MGPPLTLYSNQLTGTMDPAAEPFEPSALPSEPDMIFARGLRVAIQGCREKGHGMLDQIYATIEQACHVNSYTVDLLIICGDFQATRNSRDLLSMAVPQKYRHMCDFYKYYNGSKTAPIPTVFVGGNHEASSHLYELSLGGWVAPNIYYLGNTGVVNVNGIRIAGVSGIYNENSYRRPRSDKPPYDDRTMRGAYHYRAHELFKMNMLSGDVDIFVSHDWPVGITRYGNERRLLQIKRHFQAEVAAGKLGSPPLMGMLRKLRPRYWFAAHMHVKFAALVDHAAAPRTEAADDDAGDWTAITEDAPAAKNADEIDLDMDDDSTAAPEPSKEKQTAPAPTSTSTAAEAEVKAETYPSPPTTNPQTRFLALDKLLPRRDFLQILTIPSTSPLPPTSPHRTALRYDREWLAIQRALEPLDMSTGVGLSQFMKFANNTPAVEKRIREERAWVDENIADEQLLVPQNWEQTAKMQWDDHTKASRPPDLVHNPQTETLCKLLGIENKWTPGPQRTFVPSPSPSHAGPSGHPSGHLPASSALGGTRPGTGLKTFIRRAFSSTSCTYTNPITALSPTSFAAASLASTCRTASTVFSNRLSRSVASTRRTTSSPSDSVRSSSPMGRKLVFHFPQRVAGVDVDADGVGAQCAFRVAEKIPFDGGVAAGTLERGFAVDDAGGVGQFEDADGGCCGEGFEGGVVQAFGAEDCDCGYGELGDDVGDQVAGEVVWWGEGRGTFNVVFETAVDGDAHAGDELLVPLDTGLRRLETYTSGSLTGIALGALMGLLPNPSSTSITLPKLAALIVPGRLNIPSAPASRFTTMGLRPCRIAYPANILHSVVLPTSAGPMRSMRGPCAPSVVGGQSAAATRDFSRAMCRLSPFDNSVPKSSAVPEVRRTVVVAFAATSKRNSWCGLSSRVKEVVAVSCVIHRIVLAGKKAGGEGDSWAGEVEAGEGHRGEVTEGGRLPYTWAIAVVKLAMAWATATIQHRSLHHPPPPIHPIPSSVVTFPRPSLNDQTPSPSPSYPLSGSRMFSGGSIDGTNSSAAYPMPKMPTIAPGTQLHADLWYSTVPMSR
ncbi:LOW QUALITY PROTEIN: hypothetical protein Dda_6825 [Drechslerella dactyloides]|uniref:Lariat debranching enzyme C-terminal domain-containing protein n=1 Tax=Drechslerella dactyloides TaxID=74499 RepID=A0AAD6NHW1_DREDA|nr:LOW QUALITY PROTEIN: hypothetical protein Dda_6825 [Drechslerella dactyloides]